MPIDVLIATPSGPFGELIRLSLEADPQFKCAIINDSIEVLSGFTHTEAAAVIFDCSFHDIDPVEIVDLIRHKSPSPTILLVPPENRPDLNVLQRAHPDGLITRPFDASVLPEQVLSAINKKNTRPLKTGNAENSAKRETWWNTFQTGIKETAASNGMIVQNGMIIASTPGASTALQQQVNASVLRFWNPKDSADLMRYVKDLVTGQEWMMYATHAAENAVLILLFLPQTPITKVRSQTIKLARDISAGMTKLRMPKPDDGFLETSEPPRLHEILGEEQTGILSRDIKKEFPVEWFKEADLPTSDSMAMPDLSRMEENRTSVSSELKAEEEISLSDYEQQDTNMEDSQEEEELKVFEASLAKSPNTESLTEEEFNPDDLGFFVSPLNLAPIPASNIHEVEETHQTPDHLENLEKPETPRAVTEPGPLVSGQQEIKYPIDHLSSGSNQNDLDLGIFEELYLHTSPDSQSELDTLQPISLDVKPPETGSAPDEVIGESFTGPDTAILSELEKAEKLTFEPGSLQPIEQEREPLFKLPELPQEEFPYTTENEIKVDTTNTGYEPIPAIAENEPLLEQEPIAGIQDVSLEERIPEKLFPEVGDNAPSADTTAEPQEVLMKADESQLVDATPSDSDLYSRLSQLESAEAVVQKETYTVALIPRSEADILVRQLAGSLNQTISRLSLALNWELHNLTIRPTYMQWTVTIPQTLSLEDMINIVRKETTQEIGKIEPDRISSHQEEDFWAAQNMSARGKNFTPSVHWQNFILRRNSHEIA